MTSNPQESDFPEKLSNPARRALYAAGYTQLEQLAKVSEADLLKLHGMGPKGIEQLRPAMSAKGFSFAHEEKHPKKASKEKEK
jgi:hypothetical protein